jgi:hypothetical protein
MNPGYCGLRIADCGLRIADCGLGRLSSFRRDVEPESGSPRRPPAAPVYQKVTLAAKLLGSIAGMSTTTDWMPDKKPPA